MESNIALVKEAGSKVRDSMEKIRTLLSQPASSKQTLRSNNNISQEPVSELLSDVAAYMERVGMILDSRELLASISSQIASDVAKNIINTPTQFQSYAAAANSAVSLQQHTQNSFQRHLVPTEPTKTIIIATKESPRTDPDLIYAAVLSEFNNKARKIKIKKTFKTQKGVGMEIPTNQPTDLDQIIASIKEDVPHIKDCEIYSPKSTLPTLVLQRVLKETTDLPTIVKDLCDSNNLDPGGFEPGYFVLGKNDNKPFMDVVFRVKAETFQAIKNKHFLLFVGKQQCRLRERIFVDQCQLDFEFGHTAKHCPHKNKQPKTCITCGVAEKEHSCQPGTQQKCCNCAKHKYFSTLSLDHKPNSMKCPLYARRHSQIQARTEYVPDSTPTTDESSMEHDSANYPNLMAGSTESTSNSPLSSSPPPKRVCLTKN